MKIAALFTCFNRKEKTEKAIRSLVRGNPEICFDFIVSDDNSRDGTPEMLENLKNEGFRIECLKGTGSLFYSGGMRIAMEAALKRNQRFDYALLMNDDVDFYAHSIEKLIQQSKKREAAVIVGVTCDSEGNYSYGAIQYTKGIAYVGRGIEFSDLACDTFNANCVLIPWVFFEKSGGMDPHYVHSLGDFDYGLTLKRLGAKIYPSEQYVGICNPNSSKNSWKDPSVPIVQRIKMKESPKGLPAGIWFYYIMKNFGLFYAIRALIGPYVRIVLRK